MNANEVIINQKDHPEIYKWLSEYVYNYKKHQEHYTLTSEGKINADCGVLIFDHVKQFKYPFGVVDGFFSFDFCKNLTSLINSPEKVKHSFDCENCKSLTSLIGFPKIITHDIRLNNYKFSNNPKYKEEYKLYLAMWLELLESVSNEERIEYITNYKDKKIIMVVNQSSL